MRLERCIRQPSSLEDAQEQFRRWCQLKGFEIVGHPSAHWQDNLFTKKSDVLIEANVVY